MPNPTPDAFDRSDRGRRTSAARRLAYPRCGSRPLSSIERLTGAGRCDAIEQDSNGKLVFTWTGWTDIDWDCSTTIGLRCDECSHADDDGQLTTIATRFTADDPDNPSARS